MSQENVELLRRGFTALNHGDLEVFLANVHPEVEFTSLIAEAEGQTFRGHDGVRQWWQEVVLPLGGLHGEPEEIPDLGDTVVARGCRHLSPKGGRGAADDLDHRPLPGRDGDLVAVLPRPGRSPRGRPAVGVGDVA